MYLHAAMHAFCGSEVSCSTKYSDERELNITKVPEKFTTRPEQDSIIQVEGVYRKCIGGVVGTAIF